MFSREGETDEEDTSSDDHEEDYINAAVKREKIYENEEMFIEQETDEEDTISDDDEVDYPLSYYHQHSKKEKVTDKKKHYCYYYQNYYQQN